MHFDSDDEGKNGIRNPIVSTVLYLADDPAPVDSDPTTVPPAVVSASNTAIDRVREGEVSVSGIIL